MGEYLTFFILNFPISKIDTVHFQKGTNASPVPIVLSENPKGISVASPSAILSQCAHTSQSMLWAPTFC